MGITDLRIAASMFAIFQMMANIGMAGGEGIATSLSDDLASRLVFRLLATFNIVLIPFLIFSCAASPPAPKTRRRRWPCTRSSMNYWKKKRPERRKIMTHITLRSYCKS